MQLLYVYVYGEILIDVISQNILSFTSEFRNFSLSRNTCATNPKHLFKSTNVGFMWFCWLHAQALSEEHDRSLKFRHFSFVRKVNYVRLATKDQTLNLKKKRSNPDKDIRTNHFWEYRIDT